MVRVRVALAIIVCASFASECLAQDNGIAVGPPKVFDDRSLVIMLEQLESQLRALKIVDQQRITQAIGAFQGGRVDEVARSVIGSVGQPVPAVTTTETPISGELEITNRTTTEAARGVPSTPATPELPRTLSFAPTIGVHAQDLLSDQVSLTYQIYGVRMLLERALSDRLHNGMPRLQVVLGVQVALDPRKDMKGKAAFVELTVKSSSGAPLSLVSVMPQEKTYNAYAIDRSTNAFGGAAIASVISIGYAEQRRSELMYLYKDADTLAIMDRKVDVPAETVTFGWQFRPVLGQRSVTPGVRQMFAVIALPFSDAGFDARSLTVTTRTYWRKYDNKNRTVGEKEELGSDVRPSGTVSVQSSDQIDRDLGPKVDEIRWRAVDPDIAVVSISGRNLFTDTQILMGKTAYDSPAKGLLFKSDKALELRTSIRDLAFGDAELSGRYGRPVPLEVPLPGAGILINEVSFQIEPGRITTAVDAIVQSRDGKDLNKLPAEDPLMLVGSAIATGLYSQPTQCSPMPDLSASDGASAFHYHASESGSGALRSGKNEIPKVDCWRITGIVPTAALEKEPMVVVKYPLRGRVWKSEFPIYQPSAFSLVRLGTKDKNVILALVGRGFDSQWKVVFDRNYVTRPGQITPTLITFEVPADVLGGYRKAIVYDQFDHPSVVDVPEGTPTPAVAKLDENQRPRVKKETSTGIPLTGSGLTAVKSAKFEGKDLRFQVEDRGKRLVFFITREVTSKVGDAVVLLETGDGVIPVTLVVEP